MKKKLLVPIFALGLLAGGLALKPVATPVHAEDEITEVAPAEELTTSEESEESVSDKISNFKDTYLVPLLSGVSITAVLSMGLTIVGFVLNRRFVHNRKEAEDTVLTKVLDLVGVFTKLLTEINQTNTLSKDTKVAFEDSCKQLLSTLEVVKTLPAKVDKVVKTQVAIGQLLGKITSLDQKFVSSGIAQDCQSIVSDIKELVKK